MLFVCVIIFSFPYFVLELIAEAVYLTVDPYMRYLFISNKRMFNYLIIKRKPVWKRNYIYIYKENIY